MCHGDQLTLSEEDYRLQTACEGIVMASLPITKSAFVHLKTYPDSAAETLSHAFMFVIPNKAADK